MLSINESVKHYNDDYYRHNPVEADSDYVAAEEEVEINKIPDNMKSLFGSIVNE